MRMPEIDECQEMEEENRRWMCMGYRSGERKQKMDVDGLSFWRKEAEDGCGWAIVLEKESRRCMWMGYPSEGGTDYTIRTSSQLRRLCNALMTAFRERNVCEL